MLFIRKRRPKCDNVFFFKFTAASSSAVYPCITACSVVAVFFHHLALPLCQLSCCKKYYWLCKMYIVDSDCGWWTYVKCLHSKTYRVSEQVYSRIKSRFYHVYLPCRFVFSIMWLCLHNVDLSFLSVYKLVRYMQMWVFTHAQANQTYHDWYC